MNLPRETIVTKLLEEIDIPKGAYHSKTTQRNGRESRCRFGRGGWNHRAHGLVRMVVNCLASEPTKFPFSMYLIGFEAAWVFSAPFATIPIAMGLFPPAAWKAAPETLNCPTRTELFLLAFSRRTRMRLIIPNSIRILLQEALRIIGRRGNWRHPNGGVSFDDDTFRPRRKSRSESRLALLPPLSGSCTVCAHRFNDFFAPLDMITSASTIWGMALAPFIRSDAKHGRSPCHVRNYRR